MELRRQTRPSVDAQDSAWFQRIERKKQLLFVRASSEHPSLRRAKHEFYFEHIYHSCAIEGNTLSLAETRHIVETQLAVYGKSVQEHNEVLGLDAALAFINSTMLRREPGSLLHMDDILQLHLRVLGFADPLHAGHLRTTQVYVSDHTPPPARELRRMMGDYVEWINSDEAAGLHPIKHAALAHYWLVWLHPFYDGNGRTARLLMNYLMMRFGYPPITIQLADRHLYFSAIKQANYNGDVRGFYE